MSVFCTSPALPGLVLQCWVAALPWPSGNIIFASTDVRFAVSRRPIPHIPRGPRRVRSTKSAPQLLACPRVSPEWELLALQALIKPQLKGAILHRNGEQKWTRAARTSAERVVAVVRERLGGDLLLHLPAAGDYHFVAEVAGADWDQTRAWAVALSSALPDLWLVVGRLFVKNGRFYRRRFGYKLSLVPARNAHLPRALRAALEDCL